MQIGIDLGATKIESVLLDKNGKEHLREREKSPQDYSNTLISIENIVNKIEKKFAKKFNVGVCHPGSIPSDTGLLKNANNSPWLNDKPFQKDISKLLDRTIYCENDANCFALSEAKDGSASHYKIVFGVILGSGCGGGLIVDKKIISGINNLSGEWGHNPLPYYGVNEDINVLLVEHINGDWIIKDESLNYQKKDASTVHFPLSLQSGETKNVYYTYRKEWK